MTRLVVAAALLAAIATAHSQRALVWYLEGDGVPVASMSLAAPSSPSVPDPDGDGLPGRTLTPDTYQEFLGASNGIRIDGNPRVEVWLAAPGFAAGGGGVLKVGLLECRSDGCHPLGETIIEAAQWSPDRDWTSYEVELPDIDAQLAPDSQVCVRFDPILDTTVMLGYGSAAAPSALVLPIASAGETDPADTTSTTTDVSNTTTSTPTRSSLPEDRADLIRPDQPERVRPVSRSAIDRLTPVAAAVTVVLLAAFGLAVAAFRSRD